MGSSLPSPFRQRSTTSRPGKRFWKRSENVRTWYWDKIATDGITNTVYAFSGVFGDFSAGFVAISLTVFAITTAAGWSVYGSNSLEYLTGGKGKTIFLIIFALAAMVGATMKIELVWQLSDLLNGLMAMPNLPAMLILSGEVHNFIKAPAINKKSGNIKSQTA